jgi:predicted ATP-grasp superfamily ATP-dependent carboligase
MSGRDVNVMHNYVPGETISVVIAINGQTVFTLVTLKQNILFL